MSTINKINKFLNHKGRVISTRPEVNEVFEGNITAGLLYQQILFWTRQNNGKPFFKFKRPCEHKLFKDGDSWCEELGIGRTKFDNARNIIAQKLGPGVEKYKNAYVWYWVTMNRETYYEVNPAMIDVVLEKAYGEKAPREKIPFEQIEEPEQDTDTIERVGERPKLPKDELDIIDAIEDAENYFKEYPAMREIANENAGEILTDEVLKNELEKWIRHNSDNTSMIVVIERHISKSFMPWLKRYNQFKPKSILKSKSKIKKDGNTNTNKYAYLDEE